MSLTREQEAAAFEYCLRLGDDNLILGHRISEWCGHGPELEEDIALTNIALDCIGAAQMFLQLAGALEGKGRNEDDLAYWRDDTEFRNCLLVEQPNGDFGMTIARQFLFDAVMVPLYEELAGSSYQPLAEIAAKAVKEARYHLRHSMQWVVRLGDGTSESKRRIQTAFSTLWTYTDELFLVDEVEQKLASIVPDRARLKSLWVETINKVFQQATLEVPGDDVFMARSSRTGFHSEHLGYILAEMQLLARSHPGATW